MFSKNGFGNDAYKNMIFKGSLYRKRHMWLCLYLILPAIVFFVLFNIETLPDIPRGVFLFLGIYFICQGVIFPFAVHFEAMMQKQDYSQTGALCINIRRSISYPMFYWYIMLNYYNLIYEVRYISSIKTTYSMIVIRGTICRRKEDANALFKKNEIIEGIQEVVRIPRNFTNEELIINLDIEKYNENMRQITANEES